MSNLASIVNDLKPKEKYKYIKLLKNSGFSREQSKSFGFYISTFMWKNCCNGKERNKGSLNKIEFFFYFILFLYDIRWKKKNRNEIKKKNREIYDYD